MFLHKPTAYYNEIDPFAAQWLRELINAGHIAPGYVDERSIEDVRPSDLSGFTQCHFFAGIGVWSYALRQAGWPDDKPVWTGSCPCQPFSAAGKGNGFADERHLWPSFSWLIAQRKPPVVLGEQVASKAANTWIDLVQADVEAMGYAFGCVAFPSAGVGAPHIRDRAFWVADAESERRREARAVSDRSSKRFTNGGATGGMAHNGSAGFQERISDGRIQRETGRSQPGQAAELHSNICRMADHTEQRCERGRSSEKSDGRDAARQQFERLCDADNTSPTNGIWRDADWLLCRDGKWRPVEPGTFPLANGAPARVGRLRGYGNAINAEAAKEFIAAFMEATP